MKLNLIKGLVITFAVAALGMMSVVPQSGAAGVSAGASDQEVQAAADNLYNTNKTVSEAYQKGFDEAQAAKQAAEEGDDEEEGGCCGGG